MNLTKLFSVFLFLVLFVNCSKDDNSIVENIIPDDPILEEVILEDGISDQNLTGVVFGKPFIPIGGLSFDTTGNNVLIYMSDEEADCNSILSELEYLLSTYIPFEVGVYTDVEVKFYDGVNTPVSDNNSIVTITSITSTDISLRIKANLNSDNNAEGSFTVPYCDNL